MHPSNNIRDMFNNANDASLSGNCLTFLCGGVRGQGELQTSSPGAGGASVWLRNTSPERICLLTLRLERKPIP